MVAFPNEAHQRTMGRWACAVLLEVAVFSLLLDRHNGADLPGSCVDGGKNSCTSNDGSGATGSF